MLDMSKSKIYFDEAQRYLVGGVNSPVRAYKAVGGTPPFIAEGKGCRIKDVDGNEYIDYVCSWGPLILGHAHDKVVAAINEAAKCGTSFGAPTTREIELAKMICGMYPSCEMVRFVNSGTEATLSAVRLARGATKRDKIIKFAGCYHGHGDSFLISAGSGALTFDVRTSPGVPKSLAADTIVCRYNDMDSVREAFNVRGEDIAAVIVEPVIGNSGCIPPRDGFLEKLRQICDQYGALLIFDEVITGFRVAPGGASQLYNVKPDLVTFGKIIGGGLPVGAYGGRADIMSLISPLGPVYQAGTLSGNPIAMAAGLATLQELQNPEVYDTLERKSAKLSEGIDNVLRELGADFVQTRVGSMFSLFFTNEPVVDDGVADKCNLDMFKRYFWGMLKRGIYLAPSQFEAGFMSLAHDDESIDKTIDAFSETLREIL